MQVAIRLRFALGLALCLAGIGAGFAGAAGLAGAVAGPGKITVSSGIISGQNGKALVMGVNMQGAPPAGACVILNSDSYSLAPSVLTDQPDQGGPCHAPTPETVFPAGTYTVSAGIFTLGSQTPEKQVQADVVVDGDVALVLPGSALSAGLMGDMDCNQVVDSIDALYALRFVAHLEPFAVCVGLGDVNCNAAIEAVDALGILRHVTLLPPLSVPAGCPTIAT